MIGSFLGLIRPFSRAVLLPGPLRARRALAQRPHEVGMDSSAAVLVIERLLQAFEALDVVRALFNERL
ncbi:hypothetical protein PHISCL_11080, partial [Aspergillus sclerotialis]